MQPDTYYHIYNHANGSEDLFKKKENYRFFMEKWAHFIEPVALTCAYCLMPNHFHFLVRIKGERELPETFRKFETFGKLEEGRFANETAIDDQISKTFGNFFSSYTQSFNKAYKRKGSLFIPKFKRNEIDSDEYLTTIVLYIHHNPIHHGFCQDYDEWPHSSYNSILSEKPTRLDRDAILEWLGGRQEFVKFHQMNLRLPEPFKGIEKLGLA